MFTACQRLTYKNIWNPQRRISSQIIFAFGVRMLTTAILAELESWQKDQKFGMRDP